MNAYAVLILGIARSGTSALAGTLSHLGIPFGEGLKLPDWQNPKGNFEHFELSRCNQRILSAAGSSWSDHHPLKDGWRSISAVLEEERCIEDILRTQFGKFPVFAVKDPRLVPLFHLYLDVFARLQVQPVVVSSVRDQQEVIESIRQSGYYHGDFTSDRGVLLCEHYQRQISKIHNEFGGVQVRFDELVNNTQSTIVNIMSVLPFDMGDREQGDAMDFVDKKLYRIKQFS